MFLKKLFNYLLALLFVGAGVIHFVNPSFYVPMVPPYLPSPGLLVQLSGLAELLLGILVLVPRTRRLAAWGLIALLIAVFPANVHMALHPELFPDITPTFLYVRLPFQALFIFWAWIYARKP